MLAGQESGEDLSRTNGSGCRSKRAAPRHGRFSRRVFGGDVGWVEEIWVDEEDEPRALAVRTTDGRHALLLEKEVVAVEHEQRWVVVRPQRALLELAPPRLTNGGRAGSGIRMTASWATTGEPLAAPARQSWGWRLRLPRPRRAAVPQDGAERPLWQVIAALYASLAFAVAFIITLAFLIARLISGAAY